MGRLGDPAFLGGFWPLSIFSFFCDFLRFFVNFYEKVSTSKLKKISKSFALIIWSKKGCIRYTTKGSNSRGNYGRDDIGTRIT